MAVDPAGHGASTVSLSFLTPLPAASGLCSSLGQTESLAILARCLSDLPSLCVNIC